MDSKLGLLAILAIVALFLITSIYDIAMAETQESGDDKEYQDHDKSSCLFKKAKSNWQINNPII